ncbi:hypothetical protein CLOM_g21483 [Closterium sp. NIES-68]|nr:hypothetical protein CLOM_g21483 [Closterium sp. NIES-68]GJP81174.1 hypothetical protein CLOP_g11341 [Closterium sp. NIES-67]
MPLLWQLVLAGIILALAYLTWRYKYFLRGNSKFGPPHWPVLGAIPALFSNFPYLLDWSTSLLEACPTMTYVSLGPGMNEVITANPEVLEHILKNKFSNYPKGPDFQSSFNDLLGHGIFNSDGEAWKQQRKTASLEFSARSLRDLMMVSIQDEVQLRLLPTLQTAMDTSASIDFQDILLRYTFDNICRIGFGVDPGCLAAGLPDIPFAKAFDEATKATQIRNILPESIRSLFMSWGIAHEKILKASVQEIDEFAQRVIQTRKEQLSRLRKGGADGEEEGRDGVSLGHSDILSRMMMLQKDDGGELYSERFLRDACTNFILAGRDTSSVLLTWFFWLLSWHPHVESKIVEEARSIIARRAEGDQRETFSYDELRSMTYTHAALNEALRLYPSVPADTKHVSEDDVLPDGTPVKKGWRVMYALYAMGRMTRIWGADAREYRPERWIDGSGQLKNESPFKFPAFNAGPRLCLGRDLAYLQMKSVAASVLTKYRLKPVPGHKIEYSVSLTLFMKNGLLVNVQPR